MLSGRRDPSSDELIGDAQARVQPQQTFHRFARLGRLTGRGGRWPRPGNSKSSASERISLTAVSGAVEGLMAQ